MNRVLQFEDRRDQAGRVALAECLLEPCLRPVRQFRQRHQLLGWLGRHRAGYSGRRLARADHRPQLCQRYHDRCRQHGRDARAPDRETSSAADLSRFSGQVENDGGVLIDAENGRARRQVCLHGRKPPLAQVAEPGVMRAAFGIVIMRDHRDRQADGSEQVQAIQPVRVGASLVDLIDGHRRQASSGGCGRRQHGDSGPAGHAVPQSVADRLTPPSGQCVGRAAWPGEYPVSSSQPRRVDTTGERRHGQAHARGEVRPGPCRHIGGVLLERVGSIEQCGIRHAGA